MMKVQKLNLVNALIFFSTLFCSLMSLSSFAAAANIKVTQGSIDVLSLFPSKLIPPRTVHVWLPQGYSANPTSTEKYSVVYMHDGQMLFDADSTWNKQAWEVDEVAQALQSAQQTKPFIVVAIDNLGALNRYAEFTPQEPLTALSTAEQANWYQQILQRYGQTEMAQVRSDKYLQFIVTELKPYIDKHYAVVNKRENTFIVGSSMGGLISLYGLSEYPEVFAGAACLSSHWPVGNEKLNNPITASLFNYLSETFPAYGKHKIYFDHGDQDLDSYYAPLQQRVDNIMRTKGYLADKWQTSTHQGAGHNEASWRARLHLPLLFLLADESKQ